VLRRHALGKFLMRPPISRARAVPQSGAPPKRRARPGNRALIWLLALLIGIPMMLSIVSFDTFMAPRPTSTDALFMPSLAPNPLLRVLKLALIVIGALVILSHMKEARAVLRRVNRFFLAYMVLALLSVTWSADASSTIARFVSTISIVIVSFAFCLAAWHRQRFQNVVRPLLTLILAGSLIYIAMEPDYALDFDGAGFHGLASQKNPFGELCALGTLLWMHCWIAGETKILKAILGAALGWTCLWLSKSSTSLLATAFASWLMLMLLRTAPSLRRYTPYVITLFAGLVIAYALAVLNLVPGLSTLLLGPITAITGKDMTFTNRAMIWDIIKEHAQLHPILGTGFGAYWTGAVPTSPSYVFLSRMYFWPSEAHNGYLDVVNDLGFVGLMCLLGYLAIFVRQSLQLFKLDRPQGALYLGLFFQQAMTNLSESCWFSPMGILPMIITTLMTFTLAAALVDQQRSRASQSAVKPVAARAKGLISRARF
jgi:exopolysaccharide production protein ExoQ